MMKGLAASVYRMFAADGELLYVGMSVNPKLRIRSHKVKSWWGDVAQIDFEPFETIEDAVVAELVAIRTESPKHNQRAAPWCHWYRRGLPYLEAVQMYMKVHQRVQNKLTELSVTQHEAVAA